VPYHTVNGIKIHTIEQGPSNRQLALLIHGWSSSSYALSPLQDLVAKRFYAVAVDLPGYGESEPLPGPVTIPGYADMEHIDGMGWTLPSPGMTGFMKG